MMGPRKRSATKDRQAISIAVADLNLIRAEKAMNKAIAGLFPIGLRVLVQWGSGHSPGEVVDHGQHAHARYIGVRLHTGRIHWKHYSEIV